MGAATLFKVTLVPGRLWLVPRPRQAGWRPTQREGVGSDDKEGGGIRSDSAAPCDGISPGGWPARAHRLEEGRSWGSGGHGRTEEEAAAGSTAALPCPALPCSSQELPPASERSDSFLSNEVTVPVAEALSVTLLSRSHWTEVQGHQLGPILPGLPRTGSPHTVPCWAAGLRPTV